jgi:hypothetical protein
MGSEQGTTANALMKGQGGDHITSSGIFEVSGNVGIGTDAPAYKLDVYGTYHQYQAQGGIARYDISSANANQNRGVWDFYTNAASAPDFFGRFGFKFEGGTADSFKQFQVHIADSTTPKFIIDGSGRVGIGTIAPTNTLDVNGTARVSGSATITAQTKIGTTVFADAFSGLILGKMAGSTAARGFLASDTTYQDFGFANTSISSASINSWTFGQRQDTYFNNQLGSFQIVGGYFNNAGSPSMVGGGFRVPLICNPDGTIILSGATNSINGNVLIGTTTDLGYKLNVSGSSNFNNNLTVTGSLTMGGSIFTSGFIGYSNNSRYLQFNDVDGLVRLQGFSGIRLMTYDTAGYTDVVKIDGNVAARTVQVTGSLSVQGGATLESSTTAASITSLKDFGFNVISQIPQRAFLYGRYSSNQNASIGIGGNFRSNTAIQGFNYTNNTPTALSLQYYGGNVLIGNYTADSLAKLYVSGSNTDALLRVDSPASSSILFVSGSGNVGIGTATPLNTLDVSGTVRLLSGGSYLTLNNATYSEMGYSSNNYFRANGASAIVNGPFIQFLRSGNEVARFASTTGNLLIGTTTDSGFRLDVSGSARITNGLTVSGSVAFASSLTVTSAMAAGSSLAVGTFLPAVASAQLEIVSTTRGLLPPRTSATSLISSPAQGLITYVTGSNDGLYYYNSGSQPGWHEVLTNTGSQSITGSLDVRGDIKQNGTSLQVLAIAYAIALG